MFIFLFSLISLLHSSASALLQLHLHYRSLFLRFSDARKRYHSFSSSSCCLATSATSTNVGYNLWALSPLHYRSPPLHTEIPAVAYCCAQPPALGRVRPLSPSPLDTCPSKHLPWSCKAMPYAPWPHCLAVLPRCAASKFSFVTQSFIHWGYEPTWGVITFHWPLLGCTQPLPSVSHWAWVVISLG